MADSYRTVLVVVSIGVNLRTPRLTACRVRMRNRRRIPRKRIAGGGHVVAAEQVAADLLCHTPLDVIIKRNVLFRRTAENRPFAPRQITFCTYRTGWEIAVVEAAPAAEVIVVIIILYPDSLP